MRYLPLRIAVPAFIADTHGQGGGRGDLIAGTQIGILAEEAGAPRRVRSVRDGVLVVDDEGLEADRVAEVHVVVQSILERERDGSGDRPAGGVQVEEQRLDVTGQARLRGREAQVVAAQPVRVRLPLEVLVLQGPLVGEARVHGRLHWQVDGAGNIRGVGLVVGWQRGRAELPGVADRRATGRAGGGGNRGRYTVAIARIVGPHPGEVVHEHGK